jgi:hypothetical protein
VNIAKEANMKRTRLYRAFREMNPDGTPGKITERISAKNVYAQIQEFVMDSSNNSEQGLFGIHLAYSYRAVIRGVATHWACTQRELEAAYPKCHQVYLIDYHLKSSMCCKNVRLQSTGRSIWAGVCSESKPHLLNKPNYVPWDVPHL